MAATPNSRGWLGAYQVRTAADYTEPAGGWKWVTGEPFAFSAFSDILREHVHGPKIFAGGSWVYDVFPEAHNPFVVEWDD